MKFLCFLLAALFTVAFLFGCSDGKTETIKIGLITTGMAFDEDPYNSITWKALKEAAELYGCSYAYADPENPDTQGFIEAAKQLYSDGCRMIIFPHIKMSDAVVQLQDKYKNCKFVCLDFSIAKPSKNTLCITYSQLESGFIAGIAAACELNTGSFGAILGMDIPSSQRYSYGFSHGVTYANANFGTSVSIESSNIIFVGSYNDPALAEKLASQMYISGINCILTDGKNTSLGVYAAARKSINEGINAYVAGFELDSLLKGSSQHQNNTVVSVIGLPYSAFCSVIKSYFNGSFQGGSIITLGASEDVLGLHPDLVNLSTNTLDACNLMLEKLKNGSFVLHDPTTLLK